MTRRPGDGELGSREVGWLGGEDGAVVGALLLPSCQSAHWSGAKFTRRVPTVPPSALILLNFISLCQKWSAESRHCCCCCRWCYCYCCCCSCSCFVIYCLQLPNLFLCFLLQIYNFILRALRRCRYAPAIPNLYPLSIPGKTFLLSCFLSIVSIPTSSLCVCSFRGSIVQQLFLQHQKSTRGNARNKVM